MKIPRFLISLTDENLHTQFGVITKEKRFKNSDKTMSFLLAENAKVQELEKLVADLENENTELKNTIRTAQLI